MIKKKPTTRKPEPVPIPPPSGDGPLLLYGGLYYRLEGTTIDITQWIGAEIVPTDRDGPYLFYRGTFYRTGMTAETKARLDEPWLELADALGRAVAREALQKQKRNKR
jgi:hypothetical protein